MELISWCHFRTIAETLSFALANHELDWTMDCDPQGGQAPERPWMAGKSSLDADRWAVWLFVSFNTSAPGSPIRCDASG